MPSIQPFYHLRQTHGKFTPMMIEICSRKKRNKRNKVSCLAFLRVAVFLEVLQSEGVAVCLPCQLAVPAQSTAKGGGLKYRGASCAMSFSTRHAAREPHFRTVNHQWSLWP